MTATSYALCTDIHYTVHVDFCSSLTVGPCHWPQLTKTSKHRLTTPSSGHAKATIQKNMTCQFTTVQPCCQRMFGEFINIGREHRYTLVICIFAISESAFNTHLYRHNNHTLEISISANSTRVTRGQLQIQRSHCEQPTVAN